MVSRMNPSTLTDAKRKVLDRLKRGELTVPQLAAELSLTEAAIRQHLDALAHHALVEGGAQPTGARGRPAVVWRIGGLAPSTRGVAKEAAPAVWVQRWRGRARWSERNS